MSNQRFASVWDAIEDTPEAAFYFDDGIEESIVRIEINQVQAAKLLSVTQPRVSDLMRGKCLRLMLW